MTEQSHKRNNSKKSETELHDVWVDEVELDELGLCSEKS